MAFGSGLRRRRRPPPQLRSLCARGRFHDKAAPRGRDRRSTAPAPRRRQPSARWRQLRGTASVDYPRRRALQRNPPRAQPAACCLRPRVSLPASRCRRRRDLLRQEDASVPAPLCRASSRPPLTWPNAPTMAGGCDRSSASNALASDSWASDPLASLWAYETSSEPSSGNPECCCQAASQMRPRFSPSVFPNSCLFLILNSAKEPRSRTAAGRHGHWTFRCDAICRWR
jgi:hypothetical protein